MADGAGDVAIGAQHDVSPVCWFQKYTLPFASGTSAHPSGSGSLSVGSGGGSVGSCGGGGPVRCARSGVLGVPKKDVGVVSGCQRTRSTSPSSSSEHAHSVWPFLTVWRMLSKVWSAPFSSGCAADLAVQSPSCRNSYNYPLYLDETLHFEWVESLVFRRTEIQSLTTLTSHRTEAPRRSSRRCFRDHYRHHHYRLS